MRLSFLHQKYHFCHSCHLQSNIWHCEWYFFKSKYTQLQFTLKIFIKLTNAYKHWANSRHYSTHDLEFKTIENILLHLLQNSWISPEPKKNKKTKTQHSRVFSFTPIVGICFLHSSSSFRIIIVIMSESMFGFLT